MHLNSKRFNVWVAHRRFGKSIYEINRQLDKALRLQRDNPRYGYFAPFRDQAKRIAWDVAKRYSARIPDVTYNEAELRLDIPRPAVGDVARIQLFGTDNMPALKGVYFDGVGLDEFAEMTPSVWHEAIRPTLSDRLGWADFIGTPKGQNHFYQLHEYAKNAGDPNWTTAVYRASETGIIDPDELEALRREMSVESFEQEYECSFVAALVGAYFAREMALADREGRIMDVPFDPILPVDTFWDLGISDATSIWFIQTNRGTHRIIDHLEVSGLDIIEVCDQVLEKYKVGRLGETVLPHDANSKNLQTGKTLAQLIRGKGLPHIRVVPKVQRKMESINAARVVLAKCVFDRKRCHKGIQALLNYRKDWNEKMQTFSDAPKHDWSSHSADAFQTFAMGTRDDSRSRGGFLTGDGVELGNGKNKYQAEMEYDVYGPI